MSNESATKVFERELPALLVDPAEHGKYALIHGDGIDSIWPTLEEAIQEGYNRFGLDPFLVRHVVAREEPLYFSHNISPCRS